MDGENPRVFRKLSATIFLTQNMNETKLAILPKREKLNFILCKPLSQSHNPLSSRRECSETGKKIHPVFFAKKCGSRGRIYTLDLRGRFFGQKKYFSGFGKPEKNSPVWVHYGRLLTEHEPFSNRQ